MTPYDPETGLRVETPQEAEATGSATSGPGWRPNPFLLVLAGVWFFAGTSGLLAWRVGAAAVDSGLNGVTVLVLAAVCLLTAVAAGVAHLAVLAPGWRAPEE
jgi:hypothetical protein